METDGTWQLCKELQWTAFAMDKTAPSSRSDLSTPEPANARSAIKELMEPTLDSERQRKTVFLPRAFKMEGRSAVPSA